ncbi:MAG: hypothetical protein AAF497_00945 [Planctomycetota bacterium]
MNDSLTNLSMNDPLWMDLLVDNELSADERAQFLGFIDDNGMWKQCAMAFVNEQLVVSSLGDAFGEQSRSTPPVSRSVHSSTENTSGRWWIALAAMLLGFLAAWGWQSSQVQQERQLANEVQQQSNRQLELINNTLASIQSSQAVLEKKTTELDERTFYLTKVIDNEYISVFDTPGTLPDVFLETLLIAGHDVDVSQHKNANSQVTQRITIRKSPFRTSPL